MVNTQNFVAEMMVVIYYSDMQLEKVEIKNTSKSLSGLATHFHLGPNFEKKKKKETPPHVIFDLHATELAEKNGQSSNISKKKKPAPIYLGYIQTHCNHEILIEKETKQREMG